MIAVCRSVEEEPKVLVGSLLDIWMKSTVLIIILRSIIDRLPFHLRAKCLEVADSIQESGQCPRIH